MDIYNIRKLMTVKQHIYVEQDWSFVVDRYIENLAAISHKLSDEELSPLISIGTAMYRRELRESEAEFKTKMLLKKFGTSKTGRVKK